MHDTPSPSRTSHSSPSRRDFLKSVLAGSFVATGFGVSSRSLFADSPNDKLNLAYIGCGGRAKSNIAATTGQNVVAVCDVDSRTLGRSLETFAKGAAPYSDMRKLFDEQENNIDAVVVSTPDHTHFPATARALVRGKHVYCEKPLTHTVAESRLAMQLAKKHDCVTQMGNQIHASDNFRRCIEIVRSGMLGPVTKVYTWCRKTWSNGRYQFGQPVPETLDWPSWLGPAKDRPYISNVHPSNWRRFWDFGSGTLGDMGCHIVDLPFWALNLTAPTTISATGPEVHPVGCPEGVEVQYEFPVPGEARTLSLQWNDGPSNPDIFATIQKDHGLDLTKWGIGAIFVGSQGMLIADYGRRILLPEDDYKGAEMPEPSIPKSVGHHTEWLNACRGEGKPLSSFEYSGNLTQTILLGCVAFRSGKTIHWDNAAGRDPKQEAVNVFLSKEYADGWENPEA